MRITDVDPIHYDLLFERFLNPERVSMPDIDVDFCERRRGEVIDYVTRKYGRENVAQIITFGTMKAKAVVRDVGRALDMPYADVEQHRQADPAGARHDAGQGARREPGPQGDGGEGPEGQGGHRHRQASRRACRATPSVHAAGVVIAPGPITDYAPLYKGARDEIVTQWNMKEVERVGLLKMDFLGLSTLTLIDDALKEIKRTEGIDLDIDNIPLDDAKTYQVFQDGAAFGIFQFESSGMRELLRKAKPERLDDLIALNALYRPGPLKSGMVDDYIARKQGTKEVKYDLPQLAPILDGYLRRHRLPGAGDAHRAGAGRLQPGASRHAAQGDGQEGSQGHGQDARRLHGRRARQGDQREEGHQDFRPDGVLRRVRLQQVALDGVRVPRVSDRLPEGELSEALHRGAADDRGRRTPRSSRCI